MFTNMIRFTLFICIGLVSSSLASAKLTLAKVFADHAVIQADKPIAVWGKAAKGKTITVRLGEDTREIAADSAGRWRADFKPIQASYQSFTLSVSSSDETITRKNLVAGEVWIATGQSNMQWMLKQSTSGKDEIKSCNDPHLRLLHYSGTLHPGGKKYPREFLTKLNKENYYHSNGWQPCTANSSASFSAVAYFFAKKLREKLNVPIGIIALPVGGSPIEAHLPKDAFTSDPKLKPLLKEWWKNPDYPQWCRQRAAHNLTHWLADPEKGKDPPHPFAPTFLWQAGIKPLLQYPIKGVIWYQGESNATIDGGRGKAMPKKLNHRKLVALVKAYRRHWKDETLPFYHVQLPGLNRDWVLFREMQLDVTRELKNTGMAVSIDVSHPTNVHPPQKKPVGERLARLALHGTYGKDIVPNGPIYKRSTFKSGKAIIDFENSAGLKSSDGGKLRGFEIAGSDKIFHPASATVTGKYVKLSSTDVPHPQAVRYAWANHPDCNLVNGEGLPASPFRTDQWENPKPSENVDMKNAKAINKGAAAPVAPVKKANIIRVACIGDSITFGSGIKNPNTNSYPAQLQELLGDKYEVRNFGNPGRGILKKSKRGSGKRAYIFMSEHAQAIKFEPHIVICNLGINDIMDWGRFGKAEFVQNYRELLQAYKTLNTYPRVIIWHKLAPLFKGQKFFGDARVDAINTAIAKTAKLEDVETIDMTTPFKGKDALFPDHIHPNAEGAKIIAERTAAFLKK